MKRALIAILHLILTAFIIAYIDTGIRTHDMDFYAGKDNGYFARFKSIIVLTTVFFVLMTIDKKQKVTVYLKQGGLGFVTAIILGIMGYLVFLSADYYGLTYHIVTTIICYSAYFGLRKINWC